LEFLFLFLRPSRRLEMTAGEVEKSSQAMTEGEGVAEKSRPITITMTDPRSEMTMGEAERMAPRT